jgi:hypothetical protein
VADAARERERLAARQLGGADARVVAPEIQRYRLVEARVQRGE